MDEKVILKISDCSLDADDTDISLIKMDFLLVLVGTTTISALEFIKKSIPFGSLFI